MKKLKSEEKLPTTLVMDNELVTRNFRMFADNEGIELKETAPYEPSQNGIAERTVGRVKDVARTDLLSSTLPQRFWGEAMVTAVYQINRRTTSSNENGKTPYELWTGKKPDVSGMKVFGCNAYVHIPKEKRKVWSKKAEKLKFVGYQEGTRNYRFVN